MCVSLQHRLFLCVSVCVPVCDRQHGGLPDPGRAAVHNQVRAGWPAGSERPENTRPARQLRTATPRQHLWVLWAAWRDGMHTLKTEPHFIIYYLLVRIWDFIVVEGETTEDHHHWVVLRRALLSSRHRFPCSWCAVFRVISSSVMWFSDILNIKL